MKEKPTAQGGNGLTMEGVVLEVGALDSSSIISYFWLAASSCGRGVVSMVALLVVG